MIANGNGNNEKRIYMTLSGLPLSFQFEWPFHKSTSGADFWVLHGNVILENSSGLHAPVAVNLSATVREVLTSLDPTDTEAPVINALRKEVDQRQLEFLKSGKLVPVHFSSRHWDFKRNKWVFGKASDEDMGRLFTAKVYWQKLANGGKSWLGDPTEALYVETTTEHVIDVARALEKQGLITLEGDYATAGAELMAKAGDFEAAMKAGLEELEKKHAYERG